MADRRPNLVAVVGLGIAALALAAVVIGLVAGGDGDDDGGNVVRTRAVEVTGAPLPPFEAGAADPAIGVEAPRLTGQSFAGEPVAIPADGPTLVIFLAHWCPHCQAEVPVLVDWLASEGTPAGVTILAVSTAVDPAAPNHPPSAWLDREGWTVPTLADDTDGTAATMFGLSGFPYFVALDGDGRVVQRVSGELTIEQVEALVEAARSG